MTITTKRQRQRQENQKRRQRLLAKRAGKMAVARFCYDQAKWMFEEDNIAGVIYWEHQYKEANAKI